MPLPHMPTPDQYLASLGGDTPPDKGSRRRRIIKRTLLVLFLLGVATASYILFNLFKLSVNPFSFGKLRGEAEGRINILVLGVGDPGHAGEKLSDTNMVVSINTRDKQVAMISLPRDLRVRIPGYGYGKINRAHSEGGVKLSKNVVENTLDIELHYYGKANFTGLKDAVDAVGGVEIDVKESLYDPLYPCDNNPSRSCGWRIKKGRQHMDGATALRYARCRKGNCGNDFGRALRQQEVLQAVRKKALSLSTLFNPAKLNQLSSALGKNIETDLSINNLITLANMMKEMGPDRTANVVFSTEADGFLKEGGGSDLIPRDSDFEEIQAFVKDIFKLGFIWAEHSTLVLQNGTATSGLASSLRRQLADGGHNLKITRVGNALKRDYTQSQIIDYTGGKKPHTLRYLEGLLGVKAIPPPKTTPYPPADFEIIVGADYQPPVEEE